MTLSAVPDLISRDILPAQSPATPLPLPRQLARTVLLVVVLGVLPFALDAAPLWRIIGTTVAVVLVVRSLQLVWRAVFSTDPRHLTAG
jgi:hypothetical protein